MAYDQQIQKQETETSNIVNPKTKITKGRLELLRKLDPSSSQIAQSPRTDEPSSTLTTGSRSSASDSRGMGMKKSKDQGHLIVTNGDTA